MFVLRILNLIAFICVCGGKGEGHKFMGNDRGATLISVINMARVF